MRWLYRTGVVVDRALVSVLQRQDTVSGNFVSITLDIPVKT